MERVASHSGTAFAVPFRLETKRLLHENKLTPNAARVLNQKCVSCPETIAETIEKKAADKAKQEVDHTNFNPSAYKDQVLEQLKLELKETRSSQVSAYDLLVFQIMHSLDQFNMRRFFPQPADFVCLESAKTDRFPRGFPHELRKRAEAIVVGKLKDAIGKDEYVKFLAQRFAHGELKKIKADLKFAKGEKGISFAGLMFELRNLFVTQPNNELLLKQAVIKAMEEQRELNLVHIKCLRFTYPYGERLEVLEDLSDVVIPTKDKGTYFKPRSEKQLPARVDQLVGLLGRYGVKARVTILVVVEDLDLLYPDGGQLISRQDKGRAIAKAHQYINCLRRRLPFSQVISLEKLLTDNGIYPCYQEIRKQCLLDIRQNLGQFVRPALFERKVNTQFERYFRIFGEKYSRQEARRSAAEQSASMLALSVLNLVFENLVLVEEDKGPENKLIAGAGIPDRTAAIFLKLRDSSEFLENL